MTIIFLIVFLVMDVIPIRWKHSYKEGILYLSAMLNVRLTLLLLSAVLSRCIPLEVSIRSWFLYLSVLVCPFEYYLRLVYKQMMAFSKLGYFYLTINMSGVIYQSILINEIYYLEPELMTIILLVMTYPVFYMISYRCLTVIKEELDYTKQKKYNKTLEKELMPIIREIHMVQHEYANILSGFLDSASEDAMYKHQVFYIDREKEPMVVVTSDQEKKRWFEAYGLKFPMVRNVLLSKSRKIRGLNIDLYIYSDIPVDVLEEIPLSEYDFVTILANLIDNAIEALVDKCMGRNETGVIIVQMSMSDTGVIVKVGNSHDTVDESRINDWFRMGYTSKVDTNAHGYGLHIVRTIMNKYGGHYFYEAKRGPCERGRSIRYICLYIPKQEVVL